jgi:hypothetical protein
LPLAFPGCHPSSLSFFRSRLLEHGQERYAFDRFIAVGRQAGFLAGFALACLSGPFSLAMLTRVIVGLCGFVCAGLLLLPRMRKQLHSCPGCAIITRGQL